MQKRCPYNRMVVNARTNEVEQITHYYPYGGIIGNLSSNQEAQKYKYSGKALAATEKVDNLRREREALAEGMDRTYGLDLYDVEARQYDAAAPVFDRPDDHATDYYSISPYAYCAGDPVNCVDPDGRDIFVLKAPKGAHSAGHMAALIQDSGNRQWYLYSKEGTNEKNGIYGKSKGDYIGKGKDDGFGFSSPQEFLESNLNAYEDGSTEYTEGFFP